MYCPSSVRHPALTATAIALPRDAYDFEHYQQRLTDAWLLEKSVAVRTLRMPFLAVPVGGTRRGGYYLVSCLCFGLKVRDLLLEHSGFPDLRVRWSPYPDTCFVVEWGERPPTLWGDRDATTLGRFYGYSEAAIAAFIGRHHHAPSSAVPEPCSPTAP
ncbi:DUF6302 family protein [Streptomyces sp. GXMU-J15]|jgi:hypothetical protein|uniref:DUF6302 family protein n=1 Tax=Streptomyces fuscus TaxID=3048495 RepID=A0ABT7IUS2_9ACTN|nr:MULTISPECIES: DUF6302 family protein [Streptomyces]MDL2075839.1 DUF6302 family protein [Streptomyces fuscus]SBT92804.1 hypothetical protein GA0115233_105125 [Streptomyces sp. DI166]